MLDDISFGIREQTLTLMCALTSILSLDKSHIVYLLLSFAIASSIPDIYAFTITSKEKFSSGIRILIAEIIVSLLIGLPLYFLKNKEIMFATSMVMGFTILLINEVYLLHSNNETITKSILFAGVAVLTSYFGSYLLKKAFM